MTGKLRKLCQTLDNTYLLPCQVCNAPSTGLHYGVFTCEACKIFFRRSICKYHNYKCLKNSIHCSPTDEFVFTCKLCRYQKCIDEGMSRTRIKIGRHSKQTNQEKLKKLKFYQAKHVVPLLPSYTSSDDLLVFCFNLISNVKDKDWTNQIIPFQDRLNELEKLPNASMFNFDDYLNILEVTGIEMDERALISKPHCKLFEIGLKTYLPYLKCLPGLNELTNTEFMRVISDHEFDSCAINLLEPVFKFSKGIKINFPNFSINFSRAKLKLWMGVPLVDARVETKLFLDNLQLTFEEKMLIFVLNLTLPINHSKSASSVHNRLTMALTRYLQRNYGDTYERKLYEIIHSMNFMVEKREFYNSWRKKYANYYSRVYGTPILRIVCGGLLNELDENSELVSEVLKTNTLGIGQIKS